MKLKAELLAENQRLRRRLAQAVRLLNLARMPTSHMETKLLTFLRREEGTTDG